MHRQPLPWGMTLANKILKPVKERCGLENALLTFVTFDRVQSKMVEFFMKYDIPLLEMYGMTECSGLCNLSSIDAWKLGSAGRAMCGTKVKILEPDSNGEGEVCRFHFMHDEGFIQVYLLGWILQKKS